MKAKQLLLILAALCVLAGCSKKTAIPSGTKHKNFTRIELTSQSERRFSLDQKKGLNIHSDRIIEFDDSAITLRVDTVVTRVSGVFKLKITKNTVGKIRDWQMVYYDNDGAHYVLDTNMIKNSYFEFDTSIKVMFEGIEFPFVTNNGHYEIWPDGYKDGDTTKPFFVSGDNEIDLPVGYRNWHLQYLFIDSTKELKSPPKTSDKEVEKVKPENQKQQKPADKKPPTQPTVTDNQPAVSGKTPSGYLKPKPPK